MKEIEKTNNFAYKNCSSKILQPRLIYTCFSAYKKVDFSIINNYIYAKLAQQMTALKPNRIIKIAYKNPCIRKKNNKSKTHLNIKFWITLK